MSAGTPDQGADLAAFARAREGLEQAYQQVPDEALTYVPEGEDYTLGGLAVHVTDVLLHYVHVLDLMKGANYGEVRALDAADDAKRQRDAMVRDGFGSAERPGVFRDMRAAHDALAARVRAMGSEEYVRPSNVLYGADATEPYATRAADVLGWVTDHYNEHIDQVGQLVERWKQSRT